PAQKAAGLAQTLGVDREEVNRCLSYRLAGEVQQDAAYRWRLRGAAERSRPTRVEAAPSELGRLARSCLECIGQDSDEGVSTFAASRYGEPDYAELEAPPIGDDAGDWWNSAGAGRVLG